MKLFERFFAKTPTAPATRDERIEPDARAGRAAAAPAADPAAMAAAQARELDALEDPAQIARFVIEGSTSQLRQLAAQRVEDPEQLRRLLSQVRGKDKSVYKIIREKCDALTAAERRAAQYASEVEAVCASLERHARRSHEPLYVATLEHLIGRWQALSPAPDASSAQRCQEAVDRCREVIAGHVRLVAQEALRQAAAQAAQEAREREQMAAREAAAARADADARVREAAAAVERAEAALQSEMRAARERIVRQIGGLIRKAGEALSGGKTQQAAGLRRAIEEKLPSLASKPPHLTRQLHELDSNLNELKQWKDYAVAPKRAALIGEMESLIGSSEEPQALSRRIKSLQDEWRTISKGIVSDTPAEWERFHQASQAAYQPCREYFAAQARRREENLVHRQTLLERLTAFEASQGGEQTDWRLLASVLREAPQEWRRFFPVDRGASRAVQAGFEASLARLQARLDGWYERNVADKQSLIKRARHLLAQEDTREAIDAVKRLQILWKETGQAPRDQDQSLWSEFREVCDAVYSRRDQAHSDYTAGLEAAKLKAVELCEEVERMSGSSGPELAAAAARIPEWQSAFEALDEMPRAEARGLHDRFKRALAGFETQLTRERRRDDERSRENLLEAVRRVRTYEWAVLRGAEDREALKQGVVTFMAGIPRWPKGALNALKEALAAADSIAAGNGDAAEKALRLLCIRAEILGDASSPAEDESLRRDYQVQRLMSGMGQGAQAAGDWDALLLEWIRIGGLPPAVHDALQKRFIACLARKPALLPERPGFLMQSAPDDRGDRRHRTEPRPVRAR